MDLEFGTEEQKRRWIGPTLRGAVMWCQGYSEPDAGSDLASLRTSAREDGDDFVINGQKIWTSTADKSEMIFLLVRTEPGASKHAGISYLLASMESPGIEVRPLRTMAGDLGGNSFNQVFFTDVRVPQANVVGKRGEGWRIANTTLKQERNSLNSNPEGILLRLIALMTRETVNGVPAMASPVYRLDRRAEPALLVQAYRRGTPSIGGTGIPAQPRRGAPGLRDRRPGGAGQRPGMTAPNGGRIP